MTEPAPADGITLDDLKQRAQALDITIAEDAWDDVYPIFSRAIAAVRAFDDAELRAQEPSVVFRVGSS